MRKILFFAVWLAGTTVWGASFVELRQEFSDGEVPFVKDMRTGSAWNCVTLYAGNGPAAPQEKLFSFGTCLGNDLCFYNGQAGSLPYWFPAWFSYGSNDAKQVSTTVPFKTKGLISDCRGKMSSCELTGTQFNNDAFIRKGKTGHLLVEWASPWALQIPWVSVADKNQKAMAYSICEP